MSTYQDTPFGHAIGLDLARRIGAAASDAARDAGWPMCIAIVDFHGELVYFERADNTQLGSVDVAIGKARTSARFKRSTRALEDAIAGGRQVMLRLADAVPIQGGLPIVIGGRFVGAIGVSGMASQQDEQVASAGLAVLTDA